MGDSATGHQIEFIRLNGHAIRVTSWRPEGDTGGFSMVTITRGSRDAELLDDLLGQDRLEIQIEGQASFPVTAQEIERRTFGEGQSGITRFAVSFSPGEAETSGPAAPPERSLEDRVAALEAEVQQLRDLITDLTNRA